MRFVCLAALLAVALAAPARARDPGPPTKLWSEFPLAPRVEQAGSSNIGPLLTDGPRDRGAGWRAALGRRMARNRSARCRRAARGRTSRGAGDCVRARRLDGRAQRRRVRAPRARVPERRRDRGSRSWRRDAAPVAVEPVPAQYAPPMPLEEPEVEDEPRRFVMRRTRAPAVPLRRSRQRARRTAQRAGAVEELFEDRKRCRARASSRGRVGRPDERSAVGGLGARAASRVRLLRFAPANRRRRRVAGHADDRRIHARPRRSVRRLTPHRRDARRPRA